MDFVQEYYEARFKPVDEDVIVAGYCGETVEEAMKRAREQSELRAEDEGKRGVAEIAVYHCTRVI